MGQVVGPEKTKCSDQIYYTKTWQGTYKS